MINLIKLFIFDIKESKTKKVLFHYKINERKSKTSFLIHKIDEVHICSDFDKIYHKPLRGVEMNLKIRSEQTFFFLVRIWLKKVKLKILLKLLKKLMII